MRSAGTSSGELAAFVWSRDKKAVCDAIAQSYSPLKIILKTKDEDFFIERWFEHYLAILRPEDTIIVLDNMSTSERVYSVYKRHAYRILLVRYEGHVDSAHSLQCFGALYNAVWASSLFYVLLDTDEYLALYDGEQVIMDRRLLRYVRDNTDVAFFPPLFVNNLWARDDAFLFEEKGLFRYHSLGKPLLNAALMREHLRKPVGHTRDIPAHLLTLRSPLCFVLFHMTRLSREHRIRSAMRKLRSFGLIQDERDRSRVLALAAESVTIPMVRNYICEVQRLSGIEDEQTFTKADLHREHFIVHSGGALSFSSARTRALFAEQVTFRKDLRDVVDITALS